ncbi:unnamed protein product [Porites lobata]|uniref:G-protein coupled receptors family 1 profile domain-containing protein n=1 Tax=Porites lobata TaxID=104759 RepID=A0ABN8MY09_9CNID|nr:unnamed protein product [Porites lobata]
MSNTTANSSGNYVCASASCIFTKEERDVIVVSLFSIAVISLAGNIPILIVILFSAKRRNSSNLSTVNLVVSDLLMTVFCIPFVTLDMYVYDAWVFGSAMCRLVTFVQNSAIVASLLNLLTITCEKFLAIRFPFHLRLRKKLVCRSMPVAWIIAIAHSIFYVHFRRRMEFGGTYYCIDDWPDSQTLTKALVILKSSMFFVPLTLIVVLHSITMHTLFRGRNTFQLQQHNGDRNLFRTTARKQRRQRKAVKIILATLVSIIMCWGPFHILTLFLLLRQDEGFGRNVYIAYTVSVWLLFSHCSVLPFIFFFLTKKDVSGEESWLEMAQECVVKEGKRRLYPRRTRASFKNNSVKHSINKTPETSLGRLCGDSTETVRHIVSGCSKLAQREYRKNQDKVALQVHYELCRTYGLERTDKKYDHHPVPVAENGELRIINNYSLKSR